jgi:hypothetical protein
MISLRGARARAMQSTLAMMPNTKSRIASSARTLTLRKETLRELGSVELRGVVGGDNSQLAPCTDPRHTVMLPDDGTDLVGNPATSTR